MMSSLTSTNNIAQKFLSQDSIVLEDLTKQLVTPKLDKKLQKYAEEVSDISKQTGEDIYKYVYPLTEEQRITTRQDQVTLVNSQSAIPSYDFSGFQKLLEEDKQKAKQIIDELVAKARATKQEFIKEFSEGPIHPYEQMIQEYLGKNFKPKIVEELTIEPNIDPLLVLAEITDLSRNLQEKAMLQVRQIVDQAMDTSFPGITAEALGTAFATLSGDKFIVDKEMTKRHLEFVENIRAIPASYIVEHPYEAAKRILSEFKRCEYSF